VLAYDTQYAMVDRDDDIKIGMRTSAITLGRADVPFIMLCDGLFLGCWAWVLWPWVMRPIMGCVLVLAVAQVVWHGCLIAPRQRQGCFRAFGLNHYLGLTFFAGLLASQCLASVGVNL
jgi:4-hydroxybenzoate polyprenyltransferase